MRLYVTRKKEQDDAKLHFVVIDDGVDIIHKSTNYRILAMEIFSSRLSFCLSHKYIPTIGRFLHKKDIYV